jgi:tRNA (adenine-N(1)-)-methyltransferase non-catalytic subunit
MSELEVKSDIQDVDMKESASSKKVDEPCDPLLILPGNTLQEGDHFILVFGDGRQVFGQCLAFKKGQKSPVKINKKSYQTYNLVGLPYGTVLEQGPNKLIPLDATENLIPHFPSIPMAPTPPPSSAGGGGDSTPATTSVNNSGDESEQQQVRDNRHLVDDNTSQGLDHKELQSMRQSGTHGSQIVKQIIENSSTFNLKTDFSRAKYVTRKQLKYQPRCHLVRCTGATVCEALFLKDQKRLMNMREDTLGQILSYSNVSAGSQVLLWETCMGVVTGALAQRMGGYGTILSVCSGQQQPFIEMMDKFNLTFSEQSSIKWVHSGDLFDDHKDEDEEDLEKADREVIGWPCALQDHTVEYLKSMPSRQDQEKFLAKRSARFARKLTRHSPLEAKQRLLSRQSDSIILVVRYDPTETLLGLLPYLAPSSPFVVYCEFIEPLTQCFLQLQRQNLAINLRVSDTWAREYQVLPGRTHPNMNMSQSGGFLLTGIKLDPVTGVNEMDVELLKEIRQQMGGRRGRKTKPKGDKDDDASHKTKSVPSTEEETARKRQRVDDGNSNGTS